MKKLVLTAAAVLAAAAPLRPPAGHAATIQVACTLPTLESIVREVGGDRVTAFSLAAGDQDPHYVSPTPALMKRVRAADLMVEIGMQLEPWADEVANGSGNARIFKGGPGRITLSTGIPRLEVPSVVSRSQGDIHPEGNPHLWLDPARTKLLAENAARALQAAAPADAAYFAQRLEDFKERIDKALFGDGLLQIVGAPKLTRLALDGRLNEFLRSTDYDGKKLAEHAGGWLAKARPLRGQKMVEFHKVWVYFASVFGFELVGTIEEKPGIAPGPKYVSQTIDTIKRDGVQLILVDNFYDPSLPNRIAKESGAHVVMLPNQVRGEPSIDDYFKLIDYVLDATLKPLAAAGRETPAGSSPARGGGRP